MPFSPSSHLRIRRRAIHLTCLLAGVAVLVSIRATSASAHAVVRAAVIQGRFEALQPAAGAQVPFGTTKVAFTWRFHDDLDGLSQTVLVFDENPSAGTKPYLRIKEKDEVDGVGYATWTS